jgi:DNA-directed RNA polymerase alpha subunit
MAMSSAIKLDEGQYAQLRDELTVVLKEKLDADIKANWSAIEEFVLRRLDEAIGRRSLFLPSIATMTDPPKYHAWQSEERRRAFTKKIYRTPIWALGLDPRSYNCLKNDDIEFIGDLVRKTRGELLRIPNFGRISLKKTEKALKKLGVSLKPSPKLGDPVPAK